jgi:hypothetical protein
MTSWPPKSGPQGSCRLSGTDAWPNRPSVPRRSPADGASEQAIAALWNEEERYLEEIRRLCAAYWLPVAGVPLPHEALRLAPR